MTPELNFLKISESMLQLSLIDIELLQNTLKSHKTLC